MPDVLPTRAPGSLGSLGLGAANLGNLYREMTDDEAWEVLAAAWDSGIRYFDTAPHYGLGLSERRLGSFLATKPRAAYVLSTKVGRLLRPSPQSAHRCDSEHHFAVPASLSRVWDFSADGVRRSLEESLSRLGLDSVDIVYLHDPEEDDLVTALATGVPAAVALRDEGLVRAVGIGSKSTDAVLAGVRTGALDLAMVAGRFTLLEEPASAEVVPECRDRGVRLVAAAVFNSGVLAAPNPGRGARYEYAEAPAEVLDRARRIEAVCRSYGVELPTAALQFPLREEVVSCVVVGAATPAQVRDNVRRLQEDVPEALWHDLAAQRLVAR